MANNLTTQDVDLATLPNGSPLATVQLSDGSHAGYAVIGDPTTRTQLASVTAGGALKTDASATTQPVSATALPLPAGASTSAAQTTGNASLTTLATNSPALGQALAAASTPVVLTAIQQSALTPPSNTGYATDANLTTLLVVGAKGTQGATGLAVQQLKDSGRANISLIIDRFAPGAAAETIITTLSYSNAYAARTTGQTTYVVTAAKTLRITCVSATLTVQNGNTLLTSALLRMRVNPAGAATIASAVAHSWPLGGTNANPAANAFMVPGAGVVVFPFPDGQEFPAGAGICFTIENPGYVVTTGNPAVSVDVTATEY